MNPVLIYPGIYRIRLPLAGKKPGPVNVYLFKGKDSVAILDTGTDASWRYLEDRLKKIRLSFRDIDQIVMSHGHVDHYGAARRILDGGGGKAGVYAHPADTQAIETGSDVPHSAYRRFLRLTGTPLPYHLGIVPMFFLFRMRMGRGCPVHVQLRDGDRLDLGDYKARIIETPGHTRGSVCFHLEREKLLFAGDHILPHITPNAFPMLETDGPPRRSSQTEFYESLEKIENLGQLTVHPAHGQTIGNFSKIHAMYRAGFSQRQQAILDTILNHPGQTVYTMALRHFPEIRQSRRFLLELYLAISEVFTHIQVLERLGRVRTVLDNHILRVEYTP